MGFRCPLQTGLIGGCVRGRECSYPGGPWDAGDVVGVLLHCPGRYDPWREALPGLLRKGPGGSPKGGVPCVQ